MSDQSYVIIILALGTFAIRFGGYLVGSKLPQNGIVAESFKALPGCLIAALLAVVFSSGGPQEWLAGTIALACALVTRSLPITMIVGIATIWFIRYMNLFS
ncbi:MAG: AzlD domain-containing protein [Alphaproteobacteria bacterium]|nr:AzlD domain-containing protein [Alphaproteobacteria bacterium]